MIRQVLYSWGKLYFPWGIEDVRAQAALRGLLIADPLSGAWECVEVVAGVNTGFDSAVFKYVPYPIHPDWKTASYVGSVFCSQSPKGRVLPTGKIRFDDPELPGIVQGLDEDPLRCDAGPETQAVNTAAPRDWRTISADALLLYLDAELEYYQRICDCPEFSYGARENAIAIKCKLQHIKDHFRL